MVFGDCKGHLSTGACCLVRQRITPVRIAGQAVSGLGDRLWVLAVAFAARDRIACYAWLKPKL
jgi:hypothetical protein